MNSEQLREELEDAGLLEALCQWHDAMIGHHKCVGSEENLWCCVDHLTGEADG